MAIIESIKISKSYSKIQFNSEDIFHLKRTDKWAVKDLDVSIESGELIGFLGPNGAGKTTFLKILSGIVHPTSGSATVLGFNPSERKYEFLKQISIVMGQKNQLWWDLPAIDSFNLLREVYQIPKRTYKKNLDMMIDILSMHNIVNQRLRNMSLGERMKCELTACFLHDPQVIFLDEPTIGLDVITAGAIRKFIAEINKKKKCTIILTSHYMGDIEALCKRVIIINKGEKLYDGEFNALIDKFAPERLIKVNLESTKEMAVFSSIKYQKKISDGVGTIHAKKEDLGKLAEKMFTKFPAENITITDPDTEEVITRIYQQEAKID